MNSSPTPALFDACVDGNFHGFPWDRDYFMAPVRVYGPTTPHVSTKYGIKWTLERSKMISLPSLHVCPVPSFWSQIWKRKHQDSALTFLAIDILYS